MQNYTVQNVFPILQRISLNSQISIYSFDVHFLPRFLARIKFKVSEKKKRSSVTKRRLNGVRKNEFFADQMLRKRDPAVVDREKHALCNARLIDNQLFATYVIVQFNKKKPATMHVQCRNLYLIDFHVQERFFKALFSIIFQFHILQFKLVKCNLDLQLIQLIPLLLLFHYYSIIDQLRH